DDGGGRDPPHRRRAGQEVAGAALDAERGVLLGGLGGEVDEAVVGLERPPALAGPDGIRVGHGASSTILPSLPPSAKRSNAASASDIGNVASTGTVSRPDSTWGSTWRII